MHSTLKRCLALAALALAALAPAALAAGDVAVNLSAKRVIATPGGKESFAPGDKARPGDVLEYRATYRNTSNARVTRLAATLPIPQGMEYVPGTAAPAPGLASLDGKTFQPLPLTRRVRLADGREAVREVPASEYRWLRWTLGSLDARAERMVKARVRVAPPAVAAAVR